MDVLADGDTPTFVDVNSVLRRAFEATEQDGHAKIASRSPLGCGSNAPAAAVSTLPAAATRRPGGVVRRVECRNPKAAGRRRGHAAVEEVFTDLVNGPLNHLPSRAFEATVAWPQSAPPSAPS